MAYNAYNTPTTVNGLTTNHYDPWDPQQNHNLVASWLLWLSYWVEAILSASILGMANSEAWFFRIRWGCQVLFKLKLNIIAAAMSLAVTLFFLIFGSPFPCHGLDFFKVKPIINAVVTAVIIAGWVMSSLTTIYTCDELCNKACPSATSISFQGQNCLCQGFSDFSNTTIYRTPTLLAENRYQHRQALNITMVIFFAINLVLALASWRNDVVKWYHNRPTKDTESGIRASESNEGKKSWYSYLWPMNWFSKKSQSEADASSIESKSWLSWTSKISMKRTGSMTSGNSEKSSMKTPLPAYTPPSTT